MIAPSVSVTTDLLEQLSRLSLQKRRRVSEFIRKFQENPTAPGINFERLKGARNDNVYTVRIDRDYRAIVLRPRKGNAHILAWVDNHDEAMEWACRRDFGVNPRTGVLQITNVVEAEQVVREGDGSKAWDRVDNRQLLAAIDDETLLDCGVPELLLPTVRRLETVEQLERLQPHISPEVYEALYGLAAGLTVEEILAEVIAPDHPIDPDDLEAALDNKQSRRRFTLIEDAKELDAILNAPLEKWRVFLHPSQEAFVSRHFSGPARVSGGPGTGKTVVALHRARYLAKHHLAPGERLLFTTYTANLAESIADSFMSLINYDEELASRVEIAHIHQWAKRFLEEHGRTLKIASDAMLQECWKEAWEEVHDLIWVPAFCRDEWESVVCHEGITERSEYLRVSRVGRGKGLGRRERADLWKIFKAFQASKARRGVSEWYELVTEALAILESGQVPPPFRSIIVDEAQDMDNCVYRLLRAAVPRGPNDLFIVGDPHQRIYGRPVVLSQCGIEVRGRARRLRINYRTTEEIRRWSVDLLGGESTDDLDGGEETLRGYQSLFNGPAPCIRHFSSRIEENDYVCSSLEDLLRTQKPESVCIMARTNNLVQRYAEELKRRGLPCQIIGRSSEEPQPGKIHIGTMHRLKGLEYPIVFIIAANDNVIPHRRAMDSGIDGVGYSEALRKERNLLFVSATRARERLTITSYGKQSPFLQELT
jgi:mRNA-degrading endonuclease RelE of RelBE toxin-antitoxin system